MAAVQVQLPGRAIALLVAHEGHDPRAELVEQHALAVGQHPHDVAVIIIGACGVGGGLAPYPVTDFQVRELVPMPVGFKA